MISPCYMSKMLNLSIPLALLVSGQHKGMKVEGVYINPSENSRLS